MAFKKAVGVKDLFWKINGKKFQPASLLQTMFGVNSVRSMHIIRDFDNKDQIFKIVLSWDSYDNTSPFGVAYFKDPSSGIVQTLSGPGTLPVNNTPNKLGSVTRSDISSGYNQSVTIEIASAPYAQVDIGFARAGKFSYAAPITVYKNNSVVSNSQQVNSAGIIYYSRLDLLLGITNNL